MIKKRVFQNLPGSMMIKDKIREHANNWTNEVVQCRRHLHAHPELSFLEYETSAFIKARLDEMGIPWMPMANTGIVAHIAGEQSSTRVIALRADMDALPIAETNDVPFRSKNNGIMHACGHDLHISSLLGTARILQSLKHD